MSMLSRFATLGGGGDPYWANVSYLLVGNGANGTTTNIKDSSSNNLTTTINGNTVISTSISPPSVSNAGSGTVFFDGNGDFLTFPQISCTGDFTVEAWVNRSSIPSTTVFIAKGGGAGWFGWSSNTLFYYENITNTVTGSFTIPNTTGAWAHYAMVRKNNVISVYVNGVAASSTVTDSSTYIVGQLNGLVGSYFFTGYVYDLRITNGVARYTANYTPPPFPPTAAMPTY